MVCPVCSVDRREDGELVILDYPRYVASKSPCPNCGSGSPRVSVLGELARQSIARRRSSGVSRSFMVLG